MEDSDKDEEDDYQNSTENIQKQRNQNQQILKQQTPRRLIKAIGLLVNVKSFYNQLTKNSRIFQKITQQQYTIIGDQSAFYNLNMINNKNRKTNTFLSYFQLIIISKTYRIFLKTLQDIPIIQPFYFIKTIWDCIQAITILIIFFMFSLIAVFEVDITEYYKFLQFAFFGFLLDIFFQFNTGIIFKGEVVKSRKEIALNYFKKYLIQDLLSLIGLMQVIYFFDGKNTVINVISYFLIYFKIFILSSILERLEQILVFQGKIDSLLNVVKLIFTICTICHIFCLLWYGQANYQIKILKRQDTWLNSKNLITQDTYTKYIYSFYYIAVTMITVGYGDITPQNYIECSFTVFTMLITGVVYAYSLNCIGNILQTMNEEYKDLNDDTKAINKLMSESGVQQSLRVKIINYLEYIYKESNQKKKNKEDEVIAKLSKQLQNELSEEIQGKILSEIPLIKDFIKKKSLQLILSKMEECLYSPGEIIYKQYDVDDYSIYYILKGQVILQQEDKQKTKLHSLEKRECFGEYSFVTGNERYETALAIDFCRIYKIKRDDFLFIIKQNEQDFENFQMLKEAVTIKQNFKFAKIKCYQCKGNHMSQTCPKTHLILSKSIIIQKYNYYQPCLQRGKVYRKKTYKQKAFKMHFKCYESIYNILQNPNYETILKTMEKQALLNDTFLEINFTEEDMEFGDSPNIKKNLNTIQTQYPQEFNSPVNRLNQTGSNFSSTDEQSSDSFSRINKIKRQDTDKQSIDRKKTSIQISCPQSNLSNRSINTQDQFSLGSNEEKELRNALENTTIQSSDFNQKIPQIRKFNRTVPFFNFSPKFVYPLKVQVSDIESDININILDNYEASNKPGKDFSDVNLDIDQMVRKIENESSYQCQSPYQRSLRSQNSQIISKKNFSQEFHQRKSVTFDNINIKIFQQQQNAAQKQFSIQKSSESGMRQSGTQTKIQKMNSFMENRRKTMSASSKSSLNISMNELGSKKNIPQKRKSILKQNVRQKFSIGKDNSSFDKLTQQLQNELQNFRADQFEYVDNSDLDQIKSFNYYYPHNNFQKVLEKYDAIYKKQIEKILRKKSTINAKKKTRRNNIVNLIQSAVSPMKFALQHKPKDK